MIHDSETKGAKKLRFYSYFMEVSQQASKDVSKTLGPLRNLDQEPLIIRKVNSFAPLGRLAWDRSRSPRAFCVIFLFDTLTLDIYWFTQCLRARRSSWQDGWCPRAYD